MKTKSAILSAATLLAAIVLNPASATAESVATGCLAKLSGEIYSLKAYGSAPAKKCRSGDQIIRLQLHQPSTKFAKRRFTIPLANPTEDIEGAIFSMSDSYKLFAGEHGGNCELSAEELEVDISFSIASVPPGQYQQGVREVTETDWQDEGPDGNARITTSQSNGLVGGPVFGHSLMFHDLFIDNPEGPGCTISFVIEYNGEFYDK